MAKVKIDSLSFFGFADAKPKDQVYKDAFEAAKVCAKAGYRIVNGAGPGVMKAVTDGAHTAGGKVIGVSFKPKKPTEFEGIDPNNKVDELIMTKNYLERTLKLLEMGDVYVIFNGGTGTFSEFGMAWGLARLYFGHHKPLILYGQFWCNVLSSICQNMMLRPEDLEVYRIVTEPKDIIENIKEFEKELKEVEHKHGKDLPFRL